jgi:6-phosphogluconolactonase (cycloisomerase 2 family)
MLAGCGALRQAQDDLQPPIGASGPMPQIGTPKVAVEYAYVPNDYSGNVSAYSIDVKSGALTPVQGSPFEAGSGPGGVAVDPTGKFAYVTDTYYDSGSGSVSAYTINAATGALQQVTGSPFASGTSPVGVAIDPTGKFLYTANDGSNNVSAYRINASSGALTQVKESPFEAGSRPSGAAVDPSGKFVYVTNENDDDISAYTINGASGALKKVKGSPFETDCCPLGVAVDPVGRFVYVTDYGPYSGYVSAYTINATSGALKAVKGSPFAAGSATSAVAIDAAGKFVYAANSDSWNISAYTINPNSGELKSVKGSPFASGQAPEGVAVDASGKFAVVNNGYYSSGSGGYVSTFAINTRSGALMQVPGSPFGAGVGPAAVATCRVEAGKCIPPPL